MKRKDKERKQEQAQAEWERENKLFQKFRATGPEMKKALRAKGCNLPFYDFLDSYEDEFKKMVAWAKSQFRSLHEVYEMMPAEMDQGWQQHGLPSDWTHIKFKCDDDHASSYLDEDPNAGLRGGAICFHDSSGQVRTIIEVIRNPKIGKRHKESKYVFKLPILFHEVGHVKDFEENINFNRTTFTADLIEAEVFAHLFALNQCYQRAYYISGDSWLASLMKHKDATDYRGEVVRRVLERFTKPALKSWQDYQI